MKMPTRIETQTGLHHKLIVLILAAVFFSGVFNNAPLFASEDPVSKYLASLGNWQFQWKVSQDYYPDPETVDKSIRELKDKLSHMEPGTRDWKTMNGILDNEVKDRNGMHSEIVFTVSLISKNKYVCKQAFMNNGGELDVAYYSNGDGLVYVVEEGPKMIHIHDAPEGILGMIKGHAGLALLDLPPELAFDKADEERGRFECEYKSKGGGLSAVVHMDKSAMKPMGYKVIAGGNLREELTIDENGSISDLPKQAIFVEYALDGTTVRMKQKWTLVEAAPLLDGSKVNAKYAFLPGYQVFYSTRKAAGQYKSDELILKKATLPPP